MGEMMGKPRPTKAERIMFREFDSFDEMQAFLSEQRRLANERASDVQKAIGYGDYWARVVDGILIVGYVNTLDEIEAIERGLGVDDEELAFEREMLANAHQNGYRYGRCYSILEPEGEWGSTHVSVMYPITQEQFEQVRDCGWVLDRDIDERR